MESSEVKRKEKNEETQIELSKDGELSVTNENTHTEKGDFERHIY